MRLLPPKKPLLEPRFWNLQTCICWGRCFYYSMVGLGQTRISPPANIGEARETPVDVESS